MTAQQTDTLIIGGGLIGVAIAYELAKAGCKPLVIDKNDLGSQSTRAGAGMLGAQVEMQEPGPMFDLGIASRALFADWRDELLEIGNVDIELQTPGIFRLATDEADRESLLARHAWQQEQGQRVIWFEDEDLRKELGDDVVASTYGGLYLPDDHQVRNTQLLLALAAGAKRLGARFLEQTAVISFLTEGDAIIGCQTLDGPIYADRIVLAAGAWSGLLLKQLGLDLPIFPVKGQSFLLDTYAPPTPFTLYTHGCYVLPKRNGQLYVGATEERAGFDRRPNLGALAALSQQAVQLMPTLSKLPFANPLAGLRPGTEDGLPFLGAVPGLGNLYIASGHFRNGVLLSAITGKVMKELLLGEQTSVDLTPFSPARVL
ncbi:MAG TPA: glycine oxidase ThiO [Bacilli bacterium]|nr:glycine oxidase ThiO [Bacilli bacterium]